jgi:phosphodiesterase/alkaline phosphatase D-like protein
MTGPLRSPITEVRAGDRPLSDPTTAQRKQVLVIGAMLLATTVTSALAAFSNPPVDGLLYRDIRGLGWVDGISWLSGAASPAVLATLAALLILGWGCRTFVITAAGTILAGLVLGWLLMVIVDRERPAESAVTSADSFPSLGLLVLAILAGLVPMAVESATGNTVVRHAATALLGLLALGSALAEIHAGSRWPLDAVAAFLMGIGLVAGARILLEEPSRHPWCGDCLWRRRASDERPAGPVLVTVDASGARQLHRLTLLWVLGLVVAYAVLALTRGLPRSPESGVMGSGLEVPLQWALLFLIVAGVLLARRWHVTGAIVVAFAAGLLAYASSLQYPPPVAAVVAVVAWIPALLLWLEWHRRTTLRAALAAAVATSIVLGGVVAAAAMTYSEYWGPTHPLSTTAAPNMDVVEWMWAGGVTPTSGEIRLRTANEVDQVSVIVSENPDLSRPVATAEGRDHGDRVAAVRLEALQPETLYYYAAVVDGRVVRDRVQSFRTFPESAASFSFALGSCQLGGSNGQVFDAIRATDPLFLLSMGDWNYGNVDRNDPARFRAQYDLNLTAPAQAALYAQTPIAYVWGDHDYGGNDADRTSPSRPAAMHTYRQMTPHYPLEADPEAPIYQAFTVGRVRFVLTDTRSARDPVGEPAGAYRSTLGYEQREWLLDEISQADRYGLVVWVNPDPWLAPDRPSSDTWAGFAQERRVIADTIAEQQVDNLLMVSGDAHMLAFDDGTNTDYSASQTGGFPLFHAAAIDRPGSVKGGPYTGEVLPGGGQFGTVEIQDDGTTIRATLTGWNWESERLFTEVVRFPGASG